MLVKEVTLDMANNMQLATRMVFPNAYLVTDRFHVVKLILEALQHLRVRYRWEAIENENSAIKPAKEQGVKYVPKIYPNGDTTRQLLARSRYILVKKPEKLTQSQKQRAQILFENYPDLHMAYKHTWEFRNIYEQKSMEKAKSKMLAWIEKTKQLKINEFNTAANSLNYHLETNLNFFILGSTNANADLKAATELIV